MRSVAHGQEGIGHRAIQAAVGPTTRFHNPPCTTKPPVPAPIAGGWPPATRRSSGGNSGLRGRRTHRPGGAGGRPSVLRARLSQNVAVTTPCPEPFAEPFRKPFRKPLPEPFRIPCRSFAEHGQPTPTRSQIGPGCGWVRSVCLNHRKVCLGPIRPHSPAARRV